LLELYETLKKTPIDPAILERRGRRWCLVILLGLIVVYAFMMRTLIGTTPFTSDENHYLAAGMALHSEFSFESQHTILQGPLPYYANQLSGWFGAKYDSPFGMTDQNKVQGRIGMLLFTFSALLLLLRMVWRHVGPRASVAAGLCYVLNPLLLGHGGLMSPDTALTAAFTLTVVALIFYLEQPGWRRGILIGICLGVAMATKYLALLLIPALGIAVVAWLLRPPGDDGRRRDRVLPALRDAAVCAFAAWVSVHACYRFDAGLYDPTVHAPIAGGLIAESSWLLTLVQWLPDPLVRGIDFQMDAGSQFDTVGFLGELSDSHSMYYAVALLTKLPLAFLALIGISAVWQPFSKRLPRHVLWATGTTFATLFFYLSVVADMQIGVRYILPLMPILIFFAVRPVEGMWKTGRAGRVALAGIFVWMGAFSFAHWPNFIGAFNSFGGSRPYLMFSDSTFDWQLNPNLDESRKTLLARHPGSHQMHFRSGPRIGPVIIYGLDLWPQYELKRGPVYHWLREFEPLDSEGAYYYFNLTEDHFRLLAHGFDTRSGERNRRNLCVALLGANKLMEVTTLLAKGPDLPLVRQQLMALQAEHPNHLVIIELWKQLGRYDMVLLHPMAMPSDLGRCYFELGRNKDCRRTLEKEMKTRQLSSEEMQILCLAQYRDDDIRQAIVTSKLHPPLMGTPEFANHELTVKKLEAQWGEFQILMRQIGTRMPNR
jgi:hypothetical protein